MGQERLRGIQERLQRLCSHAASCQDRYKMVVGLGAGEGTAFLRQRKDKVQRRKCRSAVPKCFGVVYEGYKGRKGMKAVICDRCKNTYAESDCVEVIVVNEDPEVPNRRFDLCRDCKKWFYKELGVKENREEKV